MPSLSNNIFLTYTYDAQVEVDMTSYAVNQTLSSAWKGESCDTVLHGICEFQVTEYLDRPINLTAISVSPTELNVSFTTEMRLWRPSQFKVMLVPSLILHSSKIMEKLRNK